MLATTPTPRGPISAGLLELCPRAVGAVTSQVEGAIETLAAAATRSAETLHDGDLQLSLEILYGLHHHDSLWSDDRWEWEPQLLRLRAVLEQRHEQALRHATTARVDAVLDEAHASGESPTASDLLTRLVAADDGPSVARFVQREAEVDQVRDLVAQKSLYHLREADFQTWHILRLRGRAKEALLQIQVDEYGYGRPGRLHQQMYAELMNQLELHTGVLDHLDDALPEALALTNTLHLFGVHRRHHGRSIGQLAAIEMTSSLPCRRISQGLQRLGFPAATRAFYDEHVLADALHEQIASVDLAGGLVADEPEQLRPVLEGAAAYLLTEGLLAAALLDTWSAGETATDLASPARARNSRVRLLEVPA